MVIFAGENTEKSVITIDDIILILGREVKFAVGIEREVIHRIIFALQDATFSNHCPLEVSAPNVPDESIHSWLKLTNEAGRVKGYEDCLRKLSKILKHRQFRIRVAQRFNRLISVNKVIVSRQHQFIQILQQLRFNSGAGQRFDIAASDTQNGDIGFRQQQASSGISVLGPENIEEYVDSGAKHLMVSLTEGPLTRSFIALVGESENDDEDMGRLSRSSTLSLVPQKLTKQWSFSSGFYTDDVEE